MHFHEGHFGRLREKFEKGTLEDHEIMELLLHYVIPRVNTNEKAHALIHSSEGFSRIFDRSKKSLCLVEGIGPKSADFLRVISEVIKRYILDSCDTTKLLSDKEQLHNYLRGIYVGAYSEEGYMLMFKNSGKFLGCESIGKGMRTEGVIYIKSAVSIARDAGADIIIIAHNHPDGIDLLSDMDLETAKKLDIGFGNAGMRVAEQYIVADGKCVPISIK